jgi:hypothetical protein
MRERVHWRAMSDATTSPPLGRPLEFDFTMGDSTALVDQHLASEEWRKVHGFRFWREARAAFAVTFFFVLVITGIPALARGVVDRDPVVGETVVLGVVIGLGLSAAAWWPGRERAKERKKLMAQAEKQSIFGPRRVWLTEEGLATHSQFLRGVYSWRAIATVRRTPVGVIVMFGDARGMTIPARAFESEAEAEAFVAAVRDRSEHARGVAPPVASRASVS